MLFSRLSLLFSLVLFACSVHAAPVVSCAFVPPLPFTHTPRQTTSTSASPAETTSSSPVLAPDIFRWRRENTPSPSPVAAPDIFKWEDDPASISTSSSAEISANTPSSDHVLVPDIFRWRRDTDSASASSIETPTSSPSASPIAAPEIYKWRREAPPLPVEAADGATQLPSAPVLSPDLFVWARDTTSTTSLPVETPRSSSPSSSPVVAPDIFAWRREVPASPIEATVTAGQSTSTPVFAPDIFNWARETTLPVPAEASPSAPSSPIGLHRKHACARKRDDAVASTQSADSSSTTAPVFAPDIFCWA